MFRLLLVATLCAVGAACGDRAPARDLGELTIRDSTYYEPETMQPYSGRVIRPFAGDSTRIQVQGTLLEGTWHGELIVYHESGRVRYMGNFDHGERCGPWTENAADEEPTSLYDQVRSEVEALGMYPPCSDAS
jgi:hypothetical protein